MVGRLRSMRITECYPCKWTTFLHGVPEVVEAAGLTTPVAEECAGLGVKVVSALAAAAEAAQQTAS